MNISSRYSNHTRRGVGLSTFVVLLLLHACQRPEPFPDTPSIAFDNLVYVERPENNIFDSLVLSFRFTDGTGDLGLSASNNHYFPYQDYDVVIGRSGRFVSISGKLPSQQLLLVPYSSLSRSHRMSYLPLLSNPVSADGKYVKTFKGFTKLPPYNCKDYQIVYINKGNRFLFFDVGNEGNRNLSNYKKDTILVRKNPYRYNFYVEFLRKKGSGYEPLSLSPNNRNDCGISLNGRFPILDPKHLGEPLEGIIKYSMPHFGYRYVIRTDVFKMRFYIYDRGLHKSNVVESPDVTLEGIKRK